MIHGGTCPPKCFVNLIAELSKRFVVMPVDSQWPAVISIGTTFLTSLRGDDTSSADSSRNRASLALAPDRFIQADFRLRMQVRSDKPTP